MKNIYNLLAKNIMAPSLDMLRGTQAMACWRELEASQWWPKEKIIELQHQRLRQLINHCYANVPYYRRIFDKMALSPDDIRNIDDLKKLPFLNKQEIRENLADLTAGGYPLSRRINLKTSGTSGQVLNFITTKHQHMSLAFAERQRGYNSIGFEFADKCIHLDYRIQQRPGPVIIQKLIDALKREKLIEIEYMIDNKTHLVAEKINWYRPKFLRGYPSVIYELARFIGNNRRYQFKLKGIITGGEQLYSYQRSYFREIFGCDTYSFYGSEEQHTIAFECPLHNGYHLAAESAIVEIVDNQGKPVPPGKEGEIIITNLHNFAMPLIRYRLGDMGVISEGNCPCGRGLPVLSSLCGRKYDSIITKSGRIIPGQYLVGSLNEVYFDLNIQEYQIIQGTHGKIVIKVVPEEAGLKALDRISTAILKEYGKSIGNDLDISVEFVQKIERSQAGKFKKVISMEHC